MGYHYTIYQQFPLKNAGQVTEELENLAEATGHTKSFHAAEAIQEYLKIHAWQVKALQKSIKRADSKSAKCVDHKKVVKWLATWGSHKNL